MPSNFALADFTTAVKQLGRAELFYVTEWSTTGNLSMTHIGITEDPIQVEVNPEYSVLTLPEHTGPAELESYFSGGAPTLSCTVVDASTSIWPLLSPVGTKGLGYQRRRSVTGYTLALLPTDLFLTSTGEVTLAYNGTGSGWTKGGSTLSAADQQKLDASIWLWRCYFDPVTPLYSHDEGGKVKLPVNVHVMQDLDQPDGNQLYTIGDPADQSIAIFST